MFSQALDIGALSIQNLTLTWDGMSNVNWDHADTYFQFTCQDRACRVHSALAEFLAPRIALLRRYDPSCSSYAFRNDSLELFTALETIVTNLHRRTPIQVGPSNFLVLLQLAQELDNKELLSSLIGMLNFESLTLDTLVLLFQTGIDLGAAFTGRFGNLRDYIASNFYKIQNETLRNLNLETATTLLSSPSLKIKDEDSLYNFVRYRSAEDASFMNLFEFVYFEYLSIDCIENFASFSESDIFFERINVLIWRRICRRLVRETKLLKSDRSVQVEFCYSESDPLGGIFRYLTGQCGGNVHDRGVVNVTASGYVDNNYPKNVVDLGTDSVFRSRYVNNEWICFDMGNLRVKPTSYSIRSHEYGPGYAHLKSWVLEVSNDGTNWQEVDRKTNNSAMNDKHVIRNFRVANVPSDGFRYVRLQQTGPNHQNDNLMIFSSFEIFGTLYWN